MRVGRTLITGVFFLVLWVGLCWGEQGQEKPTATPVILIEPTTYDAGRINQGDDLKHDFTVFNKGTAPLEIKKVKTDWGCTAVHYDETIPPGGEGKITLKVPTKRYQGQIQKSARIFSNDPKRSQETIVMKADVWTPVLVNPMVANLRGAIGEEVEKTIEIRAQKEEPLKLEVLPDSIPDEVSVALKTVEKGRLYQLKFTNKSMNRGKYNGVVKLKTNYPESPELIVRVSGFIRPVLEFRPEKVDFGKMTQDRVKEFVSNGRPPRRSVVVVLNKGNDLKIEKMVFEHSKFKSTTREVRPGTMIQLVIEPILDKLKKGVIEDRLKVYTNKQTEPLELSLKFTLL